MDNFSRIPQIKTLTETHLAGLSLQMCLAQNQTSQLWQNFMPAYKQHNIWANNFLYSVEEYDENYFKNFSTNNFFTKWAAAPLQTGAIMPPGFTALILPQGLYAVFNYKGLASQAAPMYNYIFNQWLPNSGYLLDARPHFALMGQAYKNNSQDSEEEIWVPVKG